MEYKTPPNVTYTPPSQPSNSSTSMIPSLISGGASIVGGAIDAISNAINHKRDLKAQQEENQKNREHAEMMYKKYESPQAQAQQLAAAGLNPASQGAVSTQSVGSASTSSLPTSSPSTFGSSIAEGAMNAVNSYSQRKQFQQQLDADALNQTRNFFLELSRLNLDRAELEVQIDLWREQIAASKVSREYQEKINKQLQDFMDNGGNTYTDTSNVQKADAALKEAQEEYQRIINSNADAAEKSKIRLNLAYAYQAKAQALSLYYVNEKALAEIGKIDAETYLIENRDAREEALHQFELQIAAYSAEIGLNESERSRLMLEWERFIQGDNPNFWNMLGKFLYDNTSVSSSIGYSKSSK